MNGLRALRRVAIVACASVLAGCNTVQSMIAPAGEQATQVGHVWNLMLWVCTAVYVAVLVALGLAMSRSRDAAPTTRHDAAIARGLVGWTVLVALLLSVLIGASFVANRSLMRKAQDPLMIRITGRQWWWDIQYLDPDVSRRFTTANELHLPVGRDAQIELVAGDVIHSLWIPVLGGKEDMIPGRTNRLLLTPHATGWFRGQCAEFCGLEHARMALDVRVETAAEFARWRTHQLETATPPSTSRAIAGRDVVEHGACAMCHAVAGTTAAAHNGPDLTHLASRRHLAAGMLPLDRATLERWIADPQKLKPGALMPAVPLTDQERADVTDYLMGLR